MTREELKKLFYRELFTNPDLSEFTTALVSKLPSGCTIGPDPIKTILMPCGCPTDLVWSEKVASDLQIVHGPAALQDMYDSLVFFTKDIVGSHVCPKSRIITT